MSESGDLIRKSIVDLKRLIDKHRKAIANSRSELTLLRQAALQHEEQEKQLLKDAETAKTNAAQAKLSTVHQQQIIDKMELEVTNLTRQVTDMEKQAADADAYVAPAEKL